MFNLHRINKALKDDQLARWRQFCELVNYNPLIILALKAYGQLIFAEPVEF